MRQRPLAALAALLALTIGGCSVLREPPAEQLYRFGGPDGAAARAASVTPGVRLGIDPGAFPRESAGIRILTSEGPRVSYLAGSRWAAPAEILFENALLRAFDRVGPDVTLYGRGSGAAAQALLRTDVTQFEAAYDQGAAAPPMVRVRVSARLANRIDRRVLGERDFFAERRAAANSVGEVVVAYDAAIAELLAAVATWAAETARGANLRS